MRRVCLPLILAIAGVLACVACGGGGDGATPTPTVAGSSTGIPKAVEVRAVDSFFDTEEIIVAAGAQVAIEFTNDEAAPHNIAVYETSAAEAELFVGETITGPNETVTYEFEAPAEPGEYFFRCDVHPVTMTGNFIAE